MKAALMILLIFFMTYSAGAQNVEDIKKQGSGFLWGEGRAENLQSADKAALDDLVSQISVRVSSQFDMYTRENNLSLQQYVQTALNTYSSAYLTQVKRKVIEEKNSVYVLRYLEEKKISDIFASRKDKLLEYVSDGEKAEAEQKLSDALRYYYWALLLLRSHPDNNKITYKFLGQAEKPLISSLNERIIGILKGFSASVVSVTDDNDKQTRHLEIGFQWNGQKVSDYDFTYWTGSDWTRPSSAADGIGVADLYGEGYAKSEKLRIRTEYRYEHLAKHDDDLRAVMEMGNAPFFPQSELVVTIKPVNEPLTRQTAIQTGISSTAVNKLTTTLTAEEQKIYTEKIDKIASSIRQNKAALAESIFTPETYLLWKKLFEKGNIRLLNNSTPPVILKFGKQVMARSLPVAFDYSNNMRTFVENLVFYFNSEKKVSSFAFSLGNRSLEDILNKSDLFAQPEEKMQLVQFMEHYKTAYYLKRLDYLQQIFADNALIIVGSKLIEDKSKNIDNMYLSLPGEKYRYIKLSKKEFLERLNNRFRSNDYINIQFEDAQIKKVSGKDSVFGIQILQYYYSSTYADKGYLFLMIDLSDSANPRIYVRSWQPEKNPDGSIIGLEDFHF